MKDDINTITQMAENLLEQLGFPEADVGVSQDQDDIFAVQINISPNDSGILIGFHGETIQALQTILSQMIFKKKGEFQRININIGDYREKRELALETMALNAADRAKTTNTKVNLPYLSSNERRIIHLKLSQDPDVETDSQGEGRERRLVIIPKTQKKDG